jgi:CRISPR-associated protein Csx17
MRQILLPVDPGDPADRAHRDGRWRDAPVVPGFGSRPLRQVLADVLAWRSRTAADEPGSDSDAAPFRGVPTFRRGIRVPAADLHALAAGLLDERRLDAWLRACLALDWRGARQAWAEPEPVTLIPTLALLHTLADGLAEREDSGAPPLALGPDWAVRLAAGQVEAVHADAVRRMRQAGWDAVPALPARATNGSRLADRVASGISLAAALVPRCLGARALLELHFAIKITADPTGSPDEANGVGPTEDTNTPVTAEELS